MKIATWNVNSVGSRLERLLAWLQKVQPDILCLQELKATDEAFPHEPIRQAGYHAAVFGQKTYNGVAILSRVPPANIQRGMGDDADDPQARFLLVEIGGIQIASVYVPNGQVVGSDAYAHKLRWFARLRACLERRFTAGGRRVRKGGEDQATAS
jgi:exodeoxyribonuclease-3